MSPKKPHTDPQTNTQSHEHSQTYHSQSTFILRKPTKKDPSRMTEIRPNSNKSKRYNLHTSGERQNDARTLEGKYKEKGSGRNIRKIEEEGKRTEKRKKTGTEKTRKYNRSLNPKKKTIIHLTKDERC